MEKKKKNTFIRKMFCIINVSEAGLSGPLSFADSWFEQRWSLLRLYSNNTSLQDRHAQPTRESALKNPDFYYNNSFFVLLAVAAKLWVQALCYHGVFKILSSHGGKKINQK